MNLALVFLAGFFGSMHCAGMCGAVVAAYSTQESYQKIFAASWWAQLAGHLAYNLGRVLSYALIGALLGAVGGSLSALRMVGELFSAAVGALLIISGIKLMGVFPSFSFVQDLPFGAKKPSRLFSVYTKTYGALLTSPTLESKFYIGLLTPLLPCGLLYSAFLMAAGSGSAGHGALTMAVFGTGIVPALVIVGFLSTFFRLRLHTWGNTFAAITVILMGVMMLLRGLGIPLPWMMIGGGHNH